MIENKPMKWIGFFMAAGLLPFSAVAQDKGGATWGISGWINEALIHYNDGDKNDIVQASDNGTTLGSRITLAGSFEPENSALDAGLEVILEPQSSETPLIRLNQDDDGHTGADIGVLGTSAYFGGAFGRLTVGLQSMPTDNIAVLADPSLTLWSSISPVFRGNGFFLVDREERRPGAVWGNFLNCHAAQELRGDGGIGLDCNGIYRNGVRYELPTFHKDMSIAVGYANDDVFDIAFKIKTDLGRMKFLLHAGYAENHSVTRSDTDITAITDRVDALRDATAELDRITLDAASTEVMRDDARTDWDDALLEIAGNQMTANPDGMLTPVQQSLQDDLTGAQNGIDNEFMAMTAPSTTTVSLLAGRDTALGRVFGEHIGASDEVYYDEADNLQIQLGLIDPITGIFGTVAYQNESVDRDEGSLAGDLESSDAWWLKVGIKKEFTSVGNTALTFQYGRYNDQHGWAQHAVGVRDSQVERMGVSIDQYFGSRLIIYGAYETLKLEVSGSRVAESLYDNTHRLELFTAGMTFFF